MAAICPTAMARARIMYWTFLVAVALHVHPVVSADRLYRAGMQRPDRTSISQPAVVAVHGHRLRAWLLHGLGKAAVYKHIPVYYPKNVGAVGGLVGMIGGLGGFVLPIAFGALNDLTGLWTSCFMLLFVLVTGALVWMHLSIRHMESAAPATALAEASATPGIAANPRAGKHVGALSGARADRLAAGGSRSSGRQRAGRSPARNLWLSIPALLLSFAVWQVWSVVVAKLPSVGFNFTTDQLFWLAALARTIRRYAAHLLFVHGADLRRPPVDHHCNVVADDPGGRHRLRGAESRYAVFRLPRAGAAVRSWRRQLRVVDGQHLASSSRAPKRATRSRSMPASAIWASASCNSWCRSSSPPAFLAGSAAIPRW